MLIYKESDPGLIHNHLIWFNTHPFFRIPKIQNMKGFCDLLILGNKPNVKHDP